MPKNATTNDPIEKVTIQGIGFDDQGHRYLKLGVRGADRDLPPYSMSDVMDPRPLCQDLCDAGCYLISPAQRTRLQKFLESTPEQEPSFQVVTRLGSFGSYYARPNGVIGTPKLPVELALGELNSEMLSKFRRKGSLKSWKKKIASLCTGNSRLMFAASLACTGPILSFVEGPRTGGFQISGKAETGKTAAAMVAGSIWGCHRNSTRKEKGFAESWNTTINALEITARAHCDSLLILDETNLAGRDEVERASNVINGAFRLSEHVTKGRYGEPSRPAWRLYFLSTSNLTLDQLADQASIGVDDQHRGRLVDIFLPPSSANGIYEDLHGFDGGAALTDTLKKQCRKVFGTPGYKMIQCIYEDNVSRDKAENFIAERREWYITAANRKANCLGVKPLQRATSRFATVYAAGCLAAEYDILPWKRSELSQAVLSCQFDGLPPTPIKPPTARHKLIEYLKRNLPDFLNLNDGKLDPDTHVLGSAPGYLQTHKGVDLLYLTSKHLDKLIGKRDTKRLKKELIDEGALDSSSNRAGLVQRPLFIGKGNHGFRWVHAFRSDWVNSSIVEP